LQEEIDTLESEETLNNLYSINGIDRKILSIASEQFNDFFARIQELRYRRNVLNFQSIFLKQQEDLLNSDIETINKYIIALGG